MWRAARRKKAAKKYHSGNFDTRHLTPDEHYLGRTGLRGRKIWIALAVLVFVYLIVTAHLVVRTVEGLGEKDMNYYVKQDNASNFSSFLLFT